MRLVPFQKFFFANNGIFSEHLKSGEERCIRVCSSFLFLFSTQNQVPEILIGMGCMLFQIHLIKALSVAILTTLKSCLSMLLEFFLALVQFRASKASKQTFCRRIAQEVLVLLLI